MKSGFSVALICVLLSLMGPGASADEWCSQFNDSIFCYDYDRTCASPPDYPGTCTGGGDSFMVRRVWVTNSWNSNTNGPCGSEMGIEASPDILPSLPYGGRCPSGGDENGDLGQNTVDLSSYVYKVMPGYTAVNGSDEQPLVLTFTMGSHPRGAMQFNNGYMELSMLTADEDLRNPVSNPVKAPTDYVLAGVPNANGCRTCSSNCSGTDTSVGFMAWPTVCQQEFPNALCPPKQTFIRSTIAIGALALLDNNPCHCCTATVPDSKKPWARRCAEVNDDFPDGWQQPTNVHLSYFDGLQWRVLKAGMGGPGSYGDFRYGNYILCNPNDPNDQQCKNPDHVYEGYEFVELTIKTNTVDVRHVTKMVDMSVSGSPVESWVESLATGLPRQYTGPFNRLRGGTDENCRLRNDSYACDSDWKNGKRLCKRMKEEACDGSGLNVPYNSKSIGFDNVRLSNGMGVPGACCLPDGSCSVLAPAQCTAQNGVFRGSGTTCDASICQGACCLPNGTCGDLTQAACTSGRGLFHGLGTTCAGLATQCCPNPFADSDADGDIDQRDFATLQRCLTQDVAGAAAECRCFDKNADNNLDSADLTAFLDCATGPGLVPGTVAPECVP